MAVALDSSVVIGFLDRSDELHGAADAAIRGLLRDEQLVASVITYAEVLTGARMGHHDELMVKGFFADVISRLVPVDFAGADRAAALRAESKSIRLSDALIGAAAELDPDVELLLTGDAELAKAKGLACRARLLAPAA